KHLPKEQHRKGKPRAIGQSRARRMFVRSQARCGHAFLLWPWIRGALQATPGMLWFSGRYFLKCRARPRWSTGSGLVAGADRPVADNGDALQMTRPGIIGDAVV